MYSFFIGLRKSLILQYVEEGDSRDLGVSQWFRMFPIYFSVMACGYVAKGDGRIKKVCIMLPCSMVVDFEALSCLLAF